MLRIVVIIAVLLYALLRGGKLTNFAALRVRRLWLVAVGFAIRILIDTPFLASPLLQVWVTPLFFVSFGLLVGWIWENRHLAGGALIGAGVLMNLAAVTANGGAMPVDPAAALYAGKPISDAVSSAAIADVHRAFGEQTNLWILTDIFPLPAGIPYAGVYSLGDIILTVGIAILCYRTMLARPTPRSQTAPGVTVATAPTES